MTNSGFLHHLILTVVLFSVLSRSRRLLNVFLKPPNLDFCVLAGGWGFSWAWTVPFFTGVGPKKNTKRQTKQWEQASNHFQDPPPLIFKIYIIPVSFSCQPLGPLHLRFRCCWWSRAEGSFVCADWKIQNVYKKYWCYCYGACAKTKWGEKHTIFI